MTTAESTEHETPVPSVSGPPWPTKIVVLLREGLLPWQELNVTAFLSSAVAAAVRGHDGAVIGAIGVSGPVYRMSQDRLPRLGKTCLAAAEEQARSTPDQDRPARAGRG